MRIRKYIAVLDVVPEQSQASTPYETIDLELSVDLDHVVAVSETPEKGLTEIIIQGLCYVIKADHKKVKRDWEKVED